VVRQNSENHRQWSDKIAKITVIGQAKERKSSSVVTQNSKNHRDWSGKTAKITVSGQTK
jgi:hypothetical protein